MSTASNILVFKGGKDALTQQVISAGGLVVVVFHATWCPSCRLLADMLPEMANKAPNVLFLKVDVDEAKELAACYSISSIPQLKFFKWGPDQKLAESGSVIGANKTAIEDSLSKYAAH